MNSDDLLTSFRSDIPLPDEATARRIYADATSARRRLPRRGLVLVLAVALGTAIAAVALTGGFDTGKRPVPATGDQSNSGLRVSYSRNSGTLRSIAVTLSLDFANARVQLQVLHSDASSTELYRGKGSKEVVFQSQVSTTATPPAVLVGPTGDASPEAGRSFWSGTLFPSDWNGGCQSGLYGIRYLAIPSAASFATATKEPGSEEVGDSEWFRCREG